MEESSFTNPSNNHDKPENQLPIIDQEITEQEVKTLVFPPSPPSAAADEEQGPSPSEPFIKDAPATCSPWAAIAMILGILSLLLTLTSGFLGYQYFQHIQQSATNMNVLNEELESFHSKIENLTETMKKMQEGNYPELCLKHWKQYKDNCYYQTLKTVTWSNCSSLCVSMNSTFLQSGDDMLMGFMKTFILNDTWIGISYEKDKKEWKWIDGFSFPFEAPPKPERNVQDLCGYIKLRTMNLYDCNKTLPCICEKKALSPEN
ncbi:killer cell lectin-like receptor 6 isoform X2 [Notamacropus eugenii]|uniref:killer cell lectin-like receptor 6 isoform X2 n=1 Tax=Notamacropus eugenii TaxID=9315 RepID=UPI003B684BF8